MGLDGKSKALVVVVVALSLVIALLLRDKYVLENIVSRCASTPSPASIDLGADAALTIAQSSSTLFAALDGAVPSNSIIDVNIGPNVSPLSKRGVPLVLIDPLFEVCSKLQQRYASDLDVYVLCVAISNFTGLAPFFEYSKSNGVSSSLSKTSANTSHAKFPIRSRRSVVVLDGSLFVRKLVDNGNRIRRLKTDMQGHDLNTLRTLEPLLRRHQIEYVFSECFVPKNGRQIYEIDNSCVSMATLLRRCGYEVFEEFKLNREWGDVFARVPGATRNNAFAKL